MEIASGKTIESLVRAYEFPGKFVGYERYGNGHINDTFVLEYEKDGTCGKEPTKYILQRINRFVFKKPEMVMENIRKITDFLREKIIACGGDPKRETLNLIQTKSGADFFRDADGEYWRSYLFIEGTETLEVARTPKDMYEAAKTFGRFQMLLADYPVASLHQTIPDFHNTKVRLAAFLEALEKDRMGRAKEAEAEVHFILSRQEEMESLVVLSEQGDLPLRVTHNDTKLNNILMDQKTGKGLCAADLDTVMPGLSLYDYGDAIRFGANSAAEDEQDLTKVFLDEALFEAYTAGYLEEVGKHLTPKEIELLPLGAKVITLECGMRFLMDYLEGDLYFKIRREKQNLDRCRTQLKMVSDLEQKWDFLQQIVRKYQE